MLSMDQWVIRHRAVPRACCSVHSGVQHWWGRAPPPTHPESLTPGPMAKSQKPPGVVLALPVTTSVTLPGKSLNCSQSSPSSMANGGS